MKGSFVFAGLLLMLASSGCSWMPYKKQELYLAKMQAEIEARNKASVEMRDARKNEVLAFMKSQRFIDGLVKCIHVSLEKSVFEFSDEMARCPGKVVSGEVGSYKYSKEIEAAKKEAIAKAERITAEAVSYKYKELAEARRESQAWERERPRGCRMVTPLGDGQHVFVDGGGVAYVQNAYLEGCD